jgi:hypothetical protein
VPMFSRVHDNIGSCVLALNVAYNPLAMRPKKRSV